MAERDLPEAELDTRPARATAGARSATGKLHLVC